MPASPANMKAHAILGDALKRVVYNLHVFAGELFIFRDAQGGRMRLPQVGQMRVVYLEDESGINDGLVFGRIAWPTAS